MSRKLRFGGIAAVVVLLAVELVLGWSSLAGALRQLRTPHPGWLVLALLAAVASMSAYARMQRRILHSAGVRTPYLANVRLAYAAHSLNETLPGGPAFSTQLNYQQMRRFGASPAVASWTIALSGILSGAALAVVTVGSALAAGGATHWGDLIGLGVAGVLLTLGVRRIGKHPEHVETLVRAPLAWLNRLRRRPAHHGHDRVRGFLDQLRAARLSPGHGVAAALYAVLNWLLDAVCLWLRFRAVGEEPAGVTAVLLAFCAAMAAGTITIVPGGLGIIDSALVLGLIAGGATAPAALATVVLYRVITLGFIIGVGWLSWLRIRRQSRRGAPVDNGTPAETDASAATRAWGALVDNGEPDAPAATRAWAESGAPAGSGATVKTGASWGKDAGAETGAPEAKTAIAAETALA